MKKSRSNTQRLHVISLFTGAGGLDLGLEAAGFKTKICVEFDKACQATLKANRPKWKLACPGDIHKLTPKEILKQAGLNRRGVGLLAGGPPCQPFSKAAYWSNGDSARLKDPRAKTLTAYLKVVEAALPMVILIENVEGLAFEGKDEGFKLLERGFAAINRRNRTSYKLQPIWINAADYGVPQLRKRFFLVAHIRGLELAMPSPTHGQKPGLKPYLTTWDAIGDLATEENIAELQPSGRWAGLLPTIPEGQNYLWHTEQGGGTPLFGWRTRFWSFLLKVAKSQPAWTIQAQPGPATGPFHWEGRLFSARELCRLQTFPDDYEITGSRRDVQRQLGNAVPSAIGELLGLEIRRQFFGERVQRPLRLIPKKRTDCPAPEPVRAVPVRYRKTVSKKPKAHPGEGLGPGARRRLELQFADSGGHA